MVIPTLSRPVRLLTAEPCSASREAASTFALRRRVVLLKVVVQGRLVFLREFFAMQPELGCGPDQFLGAST